VDTIILPDPDIPVGSVCVVTGEPGSAGPALALQPRELAHQDVLRSLLIVPRLLQLDVGHQDQLQPASLRITLLCVVPPSVLENDDLLYPVFLPLL
jgi:hypothetical protein